MKGWFIDVVCHQTVSIDHMRRERVNRWQSMSRSQPCDPETFDAEYTGGR
jgi:hypothetical protein